MEAKRRKVLVIGLDGATFKLIKPWARRGKLPNLARILEKGVHGGLTSTIPPVTAPAWTSFATGVNPGKHGIFDFYMRKKQSYELTTVNARHVHRAAVWDIVSDAGRKVCVINVPLTYPPKEVNGFLVSGMLTPSGGNFTYPPVLQEELTQEIGDYKINWKGESRSQALREWMHILNKVTKAAFYLLKRNWDLFIVVFQILDRVQHLFWKYMDPEHPSYISEEGNGYGKIILSCYQKVDFIVGKMLENIDEDTVVIIMSDHGFGPLYKAVYINRWLQNCGLLTIKKKRIPLLQQVYWLLSKLRLHPEDTLNRLSNSKYLERVARKILIGQIGRINFQVDIDWSRTRTYAYGHTGRIFINVKDREPKGIVKPGKEYEETRRRIIKELYALKDPESNEAIVNRVYKREEIYRGPYVTRAPDVLFTTRNGYISYSDLSVVPLTSRVDGIQSGSHRPNGIFMAFGKGVKKGMIENVNIVDLTPTILHIMAIPVPSDMDGKVLKEIFEPTSELAKREVEYRSPIQVKEKEYKLAKKKQEEVKERLRKLGYL